ncbi:protein IQ-DOMAIN 14-like isoform X1 [Hibiscus syriacus]|uniref:Protein IQ-DOMAIN 14-like isoform X1 n=1 Tax=Hibiscus syriacus TaxID=106335 RepID=A0A6A3BGI9_HIBSY|nr:receptor-like protein kinase HSL1 [Hibiscus syriacus]KAE8714132.1 protein IQ-DOMAIN 14-like isoform X1 [Hibiscus syriacus]
MSKPTAAFFKIHFNAVFLVFLLSHASSQFHGAQEQAILVKLKQYWQNPSSISHWILSSNSTDHCSWPEVTCLNNSVTELNLPNKSISGTIPSLICELQNLTSIDLNYNNIMGEFPKTLYNCSKLENLDLSQNYYIGTIPDDIDKLGRLRYLNLMVNNFSGEVPAAIGSLQDLSTLLLVKNQFNGSLPHEIGNLSKLEILGLAYNSELKQSKFPSSFKNLTKLKTLWMSGTNLIGEIPDFIADMTALEQLDLSCNRLTGEIPNALFLLKNLKGIHLFDNKLFGEIPQVIRASNLTAIDLSQNHLTGRIPSDVGKLEKLSSLVLFYNKLSGEIPESIGQISTLEDVRLFGNRLSGTLPQDFGRYSKLEIFEVCSNRLTGTLPTHLCDRGKLLGVVACDNNLKGELPRSLGNCNSLLRVDVSRNGLTGSIPSGLWTSLNLSMLMISDNMFTGELPRKVSDNLSRLEISNNRFSGEIPIEVKLWRNLDVFYASNNFFNGTIPRELTALPSLSTLLLDQNQLHGSLPSDIISWKSLRTLNLSKNQLSGQIPEAIGFLPNLNQLDLSGNQFSGQIPSQLGLLWCTDFNLSSNRLTGNIPKEFENGAYSNSFLNNPGLCASTAKVKLHICGSQRNSNLSYPRDLIWISSIAVFVLCLLVSFFVTKFCWKRNHVLDSRWELVAFQMVNFTTKDILLGLKDEKNKIGAGGSGEVYRVDISGHGDFIAVKRIRNKKRPERELEEFQAEVMTLSGIKHSNIVKLMCCMSSEDSKLLVYEYMENGSLYLWLNKHRTSSIILDWPKRFGIAVGAAQGLCYMHHDCSPPIIHRDMKSSNILLDSKFNAKIADFGLAKMLIKQGKPATISTVAGSFGYIAPEYAHTRTIDEKIDVYSFGVILLELTTGRKPNRGDEHRSLAEWAQHYYEEGHSILDALDGDVKEACHLNQMCNAFKLGLYCTRALPSLRPSMRTVLKILLQNCHPPDYRCKNTENEYHDLDHLPQKLTCAISV